MVLVLWVRRKFDRRRRTRNRLAKEIKVRGRNVLGRGVRYKTAQAAQDFAMEEQELPDGTISLGAGHSRRDRRYLRYRFPTPFARAPIGVSLFVSTLVRVRFLANARTVRLQHEHEGKRPEEICSLITSTQGLYGIVPDSISWVVFNAPQGRRKKWQPNQEASQNPDFRIRSNHCIEIYLGYRRPEEATTGLSCIVL